MIFTHPSSQALYYAEPFDDSLAPPPTPLLTATAAQAKRRAYDDAVLALNRLATPEQGCHIFGYIEAYRPKKVCYFLESDF